MSVIDKIAWIHLERGAILSSRNRGKDVYYLPGGKREPGESDIDTLVREVREELCVTIEAGTAELVGTFEAQAHGHPAGTMVRMTCYTAAYQGILKPDNEIEEIVWLTYADRDRVSPVDQIVFDHLYQGERLRAHPLAFRLAVEQDLPALVALRDAAARWMVRSGIDQWRPGDLTEDHFRDRMRDGEVWLATDERDGSVAGAWELWWEDEATWGPQPPVAGYIHRLMVAPGGSVRGAGRTMLAAAEERIAATGRRLARLDCAAHNVRLRRYYADAGYSEVGHEPRHGSRYPVTLFEKPISPR